MDVIKTTKELQKHDRRLLIAFMRFILKKVEKKEPLTDVANVIHEFLEGYSPNLKLQFRLEPNENIDRDIEELKELIENANENGKNKKE